MALGVMTRIEDLNTVLTQTQDHRQRVLVAAAKNIKVWFIKVTFYVQYCCQTSLNEINTENRISSHICVTGMFM